ncbi:MAG: MMPL family transporter, partial [Deltaproteobacteria bacterium]
MNRIAAFALRNPLLTLVLLLALTAVILARLPSLGTETGYRAYLGADHPTVRELDDFIEGFGGGLPLAALFSCGDTDLCETVFDPAALAMASQVARQLEMRPNVRRVESPATTPLLVVSDDAIGRLALYEDGAPSPELAQLRERALIDPLWRGTLVSEDGRVGAIVVELASSESDASKATLRTLEDALAPFEARGFRYHLIGQTAQFALTDEALAADSQRLTPLMIALVGVVVFALFRSWQSVVAALLTVGVASAWTLGFLATLGWPQNAITQTIAPLILVMALCNAIHLLARYAQHRAALAAVSRSERKEALLRAARDAGAPCLATTVTTAAGFLSFAASDLESFVRFGIVAAGGIIGSLLLSFTLLPIAMVWLPPDRLRAGEASERWERVLTGIV